MISEMGGNHLDINSILIVPKVKEYLSRYKSSKVLDLFGYDISGRRHSLMLSLIKYFEASSENDERIKLYLPLLKESLSKSKLHQDFELSIFLNLLKDMGYYVEELDRSLNKLAALGKFYYEERKTLFLINEAVKKLELELYSHLLVAIEKDKVSFAPVIDKWLISFNKFLKKIEDSEHKKLMEYKIVTAISRLNARSGKKMQLKTLATYIDNLAENKGEFLERICSRIAEIEQARSNLSFYEIRSLIIQRLPKKLQKIHYTYIYQNTIEVNAERIFALFEKYEIDKDLGSLSRCLLQIFEDDSVFAVFKSKIIPLVKVEAGKFSWRGDFESLVEKRAFKSFLKNVIISLSPEMRLRYKRFSFVYKR